MHQYLQKYLALHYKLSLPGIGVFTTALQPASVDFISKTVYAPLHDITFTYDETATDETFPWFLVKETSLSETDAIHHWKEYLRMIKHSLSNHETWKIAGIGTLRSANENIEFESENSINKFFPPVTADKVLRENAQHIIKVGEDEKTSSEMHELLHRETVKDRWWIGAVILAVVGVLLIAAYYLM